MRYANGSTPTRYQYTGQYSFASEFGLLDFKARYYDPQLGRFAAADTIIPQGQGVQAWDRYAYANNSPVVYNDPNGHCVYGATANSTGINWAAACSSIGNYAYQFVARVYNSVTSSSPVAGNVSSTLASFGAGYYNAAAGYYGSVYSYVPPATPALFSNSANTSTPYTSGGGEPVLPNGPDDESEAAASAQDETGTQSKAITTYWPPNDGFAQGPDLTRLRPGTLLDRFGDPGGRFLAPAGTPFEMRGLPPSHRELPYHVYEVVNEFVVQSGPSAPAFGYIGGGTQYKTFAPIDEYLGNFLREVFPWLP